jgi:thiamine biosynthesis lipoprotein
MLQTTFRAMGCHMLAVVDADTRAAQAALDEVPGWFEAWEQCLSRFRQTSELSRLNRSGGQRVTVSEPLWAVLDLAFTAARETNGLVTPTLLAALEASGYDRSFEDLNTGDARTAAPPVTPPAAVDATVERDPATRTVRLLEGTRLDLGGVAKGWAADQAARRLSAFGPALMDAGGDIAVSGPTTDGALWTVGVASPFEPEVDLELLLIGQAGVATSGRDYRRWQQAGTWRHHLLDPRTGQPAVTDVVSATVVAPDAGQADVAAKSALLQGSTAGLAWLEARPALAGLLVLEDKTVIRSRRLASYQWNGYGDRGIIPR